MKATPALVIFASVLLLTACSQAEQKPPSIEFIGTAPGDLQSDLGTLTFTDRFETDEPSIVTVISFDHIEDGTELKAMWFTPDDRSRPIGLQRMYSQSGAKIGRFQISANEKWDAAPYKVIVYASYDDDEDPETPPLRGSGAVQFFIGMTDEEIFEYKEAYEEWQRRKAEQRNVIQAEKEKEEEALNLVKEHLSAPSAVIGSTFNLNDDDVRELLVVDTENREPIGPGQLQMTVNSFAVVSQAEGILLSSKDEALDGDTLLLTVLSTGTIHVSWNDGRSFCTAEYIWDEEQSSYTENANACN